MLANSTPACSSPATHATAQQQPASELPQAPIASATPLFSNARDALVEDNQSVGYKRRREHETTATQPSEPKGPPDHASLMPMPQSQRSKGQRARRERERLERNTSFEPTNLFPALNAPWNAMMIAAPAPPSQSNYSAGQRERRQRESLAAASRAPVGPFHPPALRPAISPSAPQRQPRVLSRSALSALIPIARKPYEEPHHRHDLGRMEHECRHCKALHWFSEKLVNSPNDNPEFISCCDHGFVHLPALEPPPPPLRALFSGSNTQSKNFKDYMWEYNRALAFTSLGVKQDHSINRGRGAPVFRIQGELCHRLGSLIPSTGQQPTYAQLYIYDPRASLQHRMQNNQGSALREDTMSILQDVIRQFHFYAPIYLHAHEILANEEAEDACIRLRVAPGTDQHRYNLPTADEVAVILPGDQSEAQPRDIILRNREGGLRQISECHPAYAPLQYVLLFPHGENGWHPEIRTRDPTGHRPLRTRVTLIRFVGYRLHDRHREYSCLLRGGRLLQRYMVDMWAAADQNTLRYLRLNQSLFRSHVSNGLEDAINRADGDVDLDEIGQRVILPSTYPGGPRYMHQRFQDSLAIARYFKKVDLFLTMTCNGRWDEITRELLPGQTAYDRPDLVTRVFQLKKKALLKDILEHGVLGRVVAHVYTIEFQKRGLPHMHILIFFKDGYKLLTPEDIDTLIWARWPDPHTQPLLFETVKSCMVHGPCGAANFKAPCMDHESRTCTKRFPKKFNESTSMDGNGYPDYYRPNDGRSYAVGSHLVDNRWIVPFCPFLSAKYNCHINVECAVSLSSFKYVFKYIQKGSDMATMALHQHDEIQRWTDGRYISASEGAWRIFNYEMHEQKPSITRLQIHLPGQHMVVFNPDENPQDVLERAAAERTTLTAFFEANADNGPLGERARNLTYQEFPQQLTWVSLDRTSGRKRFWKLRERGFALGRMYFVPPTGGERFYLRMLLTVVKGPVSFQDLRSYQDCVYGTFQEACLARGLLENDNEWEQCLREASLMQTGFRLRLLFVILLLYCGVSKPAQLWLQFRVHICDDLAHRLQTLGLPNVSEEQVYDYGLHLLDKQLQEMGRNLAEWPTMPQPVHDWSAQATNALVAEQLNYNPQQQKTQFQELLPTLNSDQRTVYDNVLYSIEHNLPSLFCVDGPGGTGKTYVYRTISCKLRSEGMIVLAVASSGIAALLLPGGRTAHSMFKIPIDGLSGESICNIPKNSNRAELLRRTSLIIWDEAGMQHRHAIEAVDRSMRDICGTDHPFGGKCVLFGTDFQQTLAVIEHGSQEQIINSTLQRSYLWPYVRVFHLRENMRLAHRDADRSFANWLLDIGHGRAASIDGKITLPEQMILASPDNLINAIYPDVGTVPPPPPEYFLNRMILAPRNNDVNELNNSILGQMSGDEKTYFSADKILHEAGAEAPNEDFEEQPIPVEFLRAINDANLPPGELILKIGCPLILLRNLSPTQGLCNGSRMVVLRMDERVLEVRLVGGDHDGEIALIPRITLTPRSSSHHAFSFTRRQFPVRLAFALTINKAQGQSVKHIGLDLRIPVFAHGQLYVALSRATSSSHVSVLLENGGAVLATKNVVYPEVLLD